MDSYLQDTIRKPSKKNIILISFAFIVFLSVCYFVLSAPFNAKPLTIHVSSGEKIGTISQELKQKSGIRSEKVFLFFISSLARDHSVEIGDYFFEEGTPVWKIAWMLSHGAHNINPIKVTLREGLTNDQMATLLEKQIPNFNSDEFLSKTKDYQGYLFPDTYFFYPLTTTDEIIKTLSDNFKVQIGKVKKDFTQSGKKQNDIIVMASILEKESRGEEEMKLVSGILWKRLSLNMPLQVDAAKETYKSKGLPGEPIANPGLIAIKAALTPANSAYLYYLHDKEGMIHFAKDFAEHKKNINTYLK